MGVEWLEYDTPACSSSGLTEILGKRAVSPAEWECACKNIHNAMSVAVLYSRPRLSLDFGADVTIQQEKALKGQLDERKHSGENLQCDALVCSRSLSMERRCYCWHELTTSTRLGLTQTDN